MTEADEGIITAATVAPAHALPINPDAVLGDAVVIDMSAGFVVIALQAASAEGRSACRARWGR